MRGGLKGLAMYWESHSMNDLTWLTDCNETYSGLAKAAMSQIRIVYYLFEFFYNSSISAKFWQNPANINGEEENKKNCSKGGIEPRTS